MKNELIWLFNIVWCILCIILFFKIWGMTNDVKKIKQQLEEGNDGNDYTLLYLCGKHDELYDKLNRNLYNELIKDILKYSDKEFIEHRDKLLEKCKPYYERIGKEIPEGFKTITRAEL